MSQPAELELRQLLSRQATPDEQLKLVFRRISDFSLAWNERRIYWHFLFNTGCFEEVWQLLRDHLQTKTRVPFELMITLAADVDLVPSRPVIEALIKAIKKQSAFSDLLPAPGFDKWDERFSEMRRLFLEQNRDRDQQMRAELLEKFEFLKNERLLEQAGETLKDLRRLFPEDPVFRSLEKAFEENRARDLVYKQGPRESELERTRDLEIPERPKNPPSEADLEMVRQFIAEAERLASAHPNLPYDMAISGAFVEQCALAKDVLVHAPASPARDWLFAEMLFMARHFVECLDHLNYLEAEYATDPESTFAVTYLRAQVLKKLGQHEKAIEILQSLIRIRPDYRSAQRLLLEWNAGSGAR